MIRASATPYLTLMASLPWLPAPFGTRQLPISRRRLDARLEMLDADDAARLARIEDTVHWDRLGMHRSDAEWSAAATALLPEIAEDDLRDYLAWRFEVRGLVAALRLRAAGGPRPEPGALGPEGGVARARRNWDAADFGMAPLHPWLPQAAALHAAGDTLGLERLLVDLVWRRTVRAGEGHEFDFAAVAFYLLRWHLLQRWTAYDRPAARRRFAVLLDEALEGPGAAQLAEALA